MKYSLIDCIEYVDASLIEEADVCRAEKKFPNKKTTVSAAAVILAACLCAVLPFLISYFGTQGKNTGEPVLSDPEPVVRKSRYPSGTKFQETCEGAILNDQYTQIVSPPDLYDKLTAGSYNYRMYINEQLKRGSKIKRIENRMTLSFDGKEYDVRTSGEVMGYDVRYSTDDGKSSFTVCLFDGKIHSASFECSDSVSGSEMTLDEALEKAREMLKDIVSPDRCREKAYEILGTYMINYSVFSGNISTGETVSFSFSKNGELISYHDSVCGMFSDEALASAGVDLSKVDTEKIIGEIADEFYRNYGTVWTAEECRLCYMGEDTYGLWIVMKRSGMNRTLWELSVYYVI